ncbi:hypothetical protein CLOM_g14639 [Closterium sp. NIES-68]|nr:hypothetical protein CLOM_g14639 [Closterium sp. NIES-68]
MENRPDDPLRADGPRPPKRRRAQVDVNPACSPVATSQDFWRPVSSAHDPAALPILEPSAHPSQPPSSPPSACVSPLFPPSAQRPLAQTVTPAQIPPPTCADFPAAHTPPNPQARRRSALARGERSDAGTEVLLQGLLSATPASRRLAALGLVLLLLNGGGDGADKVQRVPASEHDPWWTSSREGPSSPCSSVGSCDSSAGDDDADTACTTGTGAAEPWSSHGCALSAPPAGALAADPVLVGLKRRRENSFASMATAQDTWQSAQEAAAEEPEQEQVAGSGAGEEAQGGQTEEFWQQQRQQLVDAIQTLLGGCAQLQRA